jgi:thiosulfate/3-mercaptopyruvate sulfurtransferase
MTGHERAVVYESGFGMKAARVAWMIEYAGIKNPVLLEGGFRSWQRHGYSVDNKRGEVIRTEFKLHPDPNVLATAVEVRSLSESPSGLVLDVRSKGEYDGSEKRECCPRSGRVPGSVWFEWTNFLDREGGFQSRQSIIERLRSMGLRHDSDIAVYCHRGARAAAAFYALKSLGYGRTRNYVGSWHEWSSKRNLPREIGRKDPS